MVNNKRNFTKVFYAFGMVLVVGGLLFWGIMSNRLSERKILENTVSAIHLTKGKEVSRWQEGKNVTLGKPVYEKIRIGYEPISPYPKKELYEEIMAHLEKNNWQRDPGNTDSDSFVATLHQGSNLLFAIVTNPENKNLVTLFLDVQ